MRHRSRHSILVQAGILILNCAFGCDSIRPIESIPDAAIGGRSGGTKSELARGAMEWMGPERVGELRFLRAPRLEELEVPDYVGANAIWGATGRDSQGRIYFGVAAYGVDDPSAALWRLDPTTDTFETLGLVNDQLDRLGVRRKFDRSVETQVKIHSKIYQAADGRMYFSSQDERDEAYDGSQNALYGGRIFAMDPNTNVWESIHTAPEGLIALAARGRYVVSQGYFGHVLYQYDILTKQMRTKKLGTYKGHASRNIFMDKRGHIYGIRARIASSSELEGVYELGEDRVRVSLVELDTELNEVQDWPLSDYAPTGDTDSHGLTGFCELRDGSIVFVTHSGALWQVHQVDGKSQLDRLGWMHPEGTAYCASLFAPFGDRFICGFVNAKNGCEWSVFDIQECRSVILSWDEESATFVNGSLVFGCETLDDGVSAYVTGWKKRGNRNLPYVLRLKW